MNSTELLDLFTDPFTIGTLPIGDKMMASMYVENPCKIHGRKTPSGKDYWQPTTNG